LEGSDLNFALEDKVAHLFFALFEKSQSFKEHRAYAKIAKEGLFELACGVGVCRKGALEARFLGAL